MAAVEPVVLTDPRAIDARVRGASLILALADGREVRVPIRWFPRLLAGTPARRSNLRIVEDGRAINWPGLDEDLGVAPLLGVREAAYPRR